MMVAKLTRLVMLLANHLTTTIVVAMKKIIKTQ